MPRACGHMVDQKPVTVQHAKHTPCPLCAANKRIRELEAELRTFDPGPFFERYMAAGETLNAMRPWLQEYLEAGNDAVAATHAARILRNYDAARTDSPAKPAEGEETNGSG